MTRICLNVGGASQAKGPCAVSIGRCLEYTRQNVSVGLTGVFSVFEGLWSSSQELHLPLNACFVLTDLVPLLDDVVVRVDEE